MLVCFTIKTNNYATGGPSSLSKGNKRSPPSTPEKPPPKRRYKKLTSEDYEKGLKALFTGTLSKLCTDVNLMAGLELIKQYIYPLGTWELELKGDKMVNHTTAQRRHVHKILLDWVSFLSI